jgi:hypothetical protein
VAVIFSSHLKGVLRKKSVVSMHIYVFNQEMVVNRVLGILKSTRLCLPVPVVAKFYFILLKSSNHIPRQKA